jgi:hypothetical protein
MWGVVGGSGTSQILKVSILSQATGRRKIVLDHETFCTAIRIHALLTGQKTSIAAILSNFSAPAAVITTVTIATTSITTRHKHRMVMITNWQNRRYESGGPCLWRFEPMLFGPYEINLLPRLLYILLLLPPAPPPLVVVEMMLTMTLIIIKVKWPSS